MPGKSDPWINPMVFPSNIVSTYYIMSYNVIGLVEKLVLHVSAKYFHRKMSFF